MWNVRREKYWNRPHKTFLYEHRPVISTNDLLCLPWFLLLWPIKIQDFYFTTLKDGWGLSREQHSDESLSERAEIQSQCVSFIIEVHRPFKIEVLSPSCNWLWWLITVSARVINHFCAWLLFNLMPQQSIFIHKFHFQKENRLIPKVCSSGGWSALFSLD